MKSQLIFALLLFFAGVGFFIAMQITARKLYSQKEGTSFKHWSSQIAYLIKNYESAHLPVILYLILFLMCYIGGMVLIKAQLG